MLGLYVSIQIPAFSKFTMDLGCDDEMFYELEIIVHLLTFKQDCKFTIYLWYQLSIVSRSAIFSKVLIE